MGILSGLRILFILTLILSLVALLTNLPKIMDSVTTSGNIFDELGFDPQKIALGLTNSSTGFTVSSPPTNSATEPASSSASDSSSDQKVSSSGETPLMDFASKEMSPSLEVLLSAAMKTDDRPIWDDEVNITEEKERCRRYNLQLDGNRTTRRRIFWGSLINDDSWHILAMHAMESYGVYDTVAFIESNTSHVMFPREIRFEPDSAETNALQGGMFGPNTRVSVDYYYEPPATPGQPPKHPGQFNQEMYQRLMIEKRWKANGMTEDDIGFLGDIDEVATRDILRALQICDVPTFRKGQDCKDAKLGASTLVFESTPMCIMKGRRWFHPDFVIGECVDQVGDIEKHPPPKRNHGYWGASREAEWHKEPNRTMFPLWTAQDFRMTGGVPNHAIGGRNGLHTAYHLHNYFSSIQDIRNKYRTYGHPVHGAMEQPLGAIHVGDVDFMVDCVMDRDETRNQFKRVEGGYKAYVGDAESVYPIAFQQVPQYPQLRHEELRQMIIEDEKLHPSDQSVIHDNS